MANKDRPGASHKKRKDSELAEKHAQNRLRRREEKKAIRVQRRKTQRTSGTPKASSG